MRKNNVVRQEMTLYTSNSQSKRQQASKRKQEAVTRTCWARKGTEWRKDSMQMSCRHTSKGGSAAKPVLEARRGVLKNPKQNTRTAKARHQEMDAEEEMRTRPTKSQRLDGLRKIVELAVGRRIFFQYVQQLTKM